MCRRLLRLVGFIKNSSLFIVKNERDEFFVTTHIDRHHHLTSLENDIIHRLSEEQFIKLAFSDTKCIYLFKMLKQYGGRRIEVEWVPEKTQIKTTFLVGDKRITLEKKAQFLKRFIESVSVITGITFYKLSSLSKSHQRDKKRK